MDISEDGKKHLEMIASENFDVWYINKETNGKELIVIPHYLFIKHSLYKELMIDPLTFMNFTTAISSGYKDVTYHNKTHGADVC